MENIGGKNALNIHIGRDRSTSNDKTKTYTNNNNITIIGDGGDTLSNYDRRSANSRTSFKRSRLDLYGNGNVSGTNSS